MTRDEYLTELQRRIAQERGYTDLITPKGLAVEGGRFRPYPLHGTLHADEGPTLVPRWPWNWCDVGELVKELEGAGLVWDCGKKNSRSYWFGAHGIGADYPYESGWTMPEAICRCYLAWKGIDLSDLPSVAPEVSDG